MVIAPSVLAVKSWALPKTVWDVRAFNGFGSFYRKFVQHFAQTAAALHALMSGDSRRSIGGEWYGKCRKAFEDLKAVLITGPAVKCPDFTIEVI